MSAKHVADGLAVPDQGPPDLQTQLEGILHEIWAQEALWRVEDRIDLAVRNWRERRG